MSESENPEFRDIRPQLNALLDEIEQISGLPVETMKFVRYSSIGHHVLVYLDERAVDEDRLLPGLFAIADHLGVKPDACEPYRTQTKPSGRCVTVSLRADVEGMPVVVKVLLDAEVYAAAVAWRTPTQAAVMTAITVGALVRLRDERTIVTTGTSRPVNTLRVFAVHDDGAKTVVDAEDPAGSGAYWTLALDEIESVIDPSIDEAVTNRRTAGVAA